MVKYLQLYLLWIFSGVIRKSHDMLDMDNFSVWSFLHHCRTSSITVSCSQRLLASVVTIKNISANFKEPSEGRYCSYWDSSRVQSWALQIICSSSLAVYTWILKCGYHQLPAFHDLLIKKKISSLSILTITCKFAMYKC